MSTVTQAPVTVHEYLHTSYSPDCDYVDGELQVRRSHQRFSALLTSV
jgi:hypothetical protein